MILSHVKGKYCDYKYRGLYMTNEQIEKIAIDAGIRDDIAKLPNWHYLIERISNQLSKDSIQICQEFVDIYTDPSNYKDSWYIDSKIDAFKQIKKAFESRYKSEPINIEIENKSY